MITTTNPLKNLTTTKLFDQQGNDTLLTVEQRYFMLKSNLGQRVAISTPYCCFKGMLEQIEGRYLIYIRVNNLDDSATIKFLPSSVQSIYIKNDNSLSFKLKSNYGVKV